MINSREGKQRAQQPCWLFHPDEDDDDDNDDDDGNDFDDKWSETHYFFALMLLLRIVHISTMTSFAFSAFDP